MSVQKVRVLYVCEADTYRLIGYREAITAVISAFRDLKGRRLADIAPPRLELAAFGEGPQRGLKTQVAPIPLPDRTVFAAHLYYAGHPRGTEPRKLLILADEATGSIVGVVESEFLSTLSTSALTIAGMEAIGVREVDRVAIIGTGKQAWMHARAISAWYRPECISIVTRDAVAARERVSELSDIATHIQILDRGDSGVYRHDAFITATRSTTPVLDGARIPATATVCAIGAHAVGASELDDRLLDRTARVVVDHADQAEATYEEVIRFRHLTRMSGRVASVHEISEVQDHNQPAVDGITVIKTGGTAFETAAIGWKCLSAAALE